MSMELATPQTASHPPVLSVRPCVKPKHRDIALIERDIAGAREWLAGLIREKEAARKSAQLAARRNDPEFVRLMREGTKRAYADPEWRERAISQRRLAALKAVHNRRYPLLPEMTERQYKDYRKIRRQGVGREEALRAVLSVD